MSDYHNRMMNIQVDAASMAEAGKPRSLRLAYKYGHRDARHAAAEIALEAQREIDDTGKKLAVAKEIIAAMRDIDKRQKAEIARLREALTAIANPRNIGKLSRLDVAKLAGAALATVEGVGNG